MSKLTDLFAKQVENKWKADFSDATLFPGIGLPTQNQGVLFLTHTIQLGKVMKIDGLPNTSPVAANSLYSAENINGMTFNIYEVQMPDIPGVNGEDSTGQIYIKALIAQGLTPAGNHFHWTGQYFFDGAVKDHNILAVHHQQYNMDAITFTEKTITALKIAVTAIKNRVGTVIPDHIDSGTCGVNDCLAVCIKDLWEKSFPDTFILPVVGFPSNNGNKYAVFSHTLGTPPMLVNGLPSLSPLSNNALYSFEFSRGKFINLYEIMLPDIPGKHGERSTVQIYVNALRDNGLDVASLHWHFYGGVADPKDRGVMAIHHQNIGLSPDEFTKKTINALNKTIDAIKKRS